MKELIIITTLLLSSGFVSHEPRTDVIKVGPDLRPYYYKETIEHWTKMDGKDFPLEFYDNKELKGNPSLVMKEDGFYYKNKKICELKDGVVDEKCPDDLPIGTRFEELYWKHFENTSKPTENAKDWNEQKGTQTVIEVEKFHYNERKVETTSTGRQYYDGDRVIELAEILFMEKKMFLNVKPLKAKGWGYSEDELVKAKRYTEHLLKDEKYLTFMSKVRGCVKKKSPACLQQYIFRSFKLSDETMIKYCPQVLSEKDHSAKVANCLLSDGMSEMILTIMDHKSFPCIIAKGKNIGLDEKYLGENYPSWKVIIYGQKLGLEFATDRNRKWGIRMFISFDAYTLGAPYCPTTVF